MHLLHGTEFGGDSVPQFRVKDGTQIALLLVHYEDDTEVEIPIIYGVHVRDWWGWEGRPDDVSGAKLVWEGTNPAATEFGNPIRLYAMTWVNPFPEKEITSMDYKSTQTVCAPFLIALTAEL